MTFHRIPAEPGAMNALALGDGALFFALAALGFAALILGCAWAAGLLRSYLGQWAAVATSAAFLGLWLTVTGGA